jgi:glucosamine--fructose-6-phosphate aminotransferase (isomerizing)
MFAEAASAPRVVRQMLAENREIMSEIAAECQARPPSMVVTCGRGSSDHATAYGKYLFESVLGLVTSSAAPSIASVYQSRLKMNGALYVAISQSGKSPDIVNHATTAREQGARIVAMVNETDSQLAEIADWVVMLSAGKEKSVAATKSYIASIASLAQLVAAMARNAELQDAVDRMPDIMQRAWELDWGMLGDALRSARNMFVVGRGVGFALSLEAALKLKETCALHAEAYSAAEVRHGPMAIVGDGLPVLVFAQADNTEASTLQFARDAIKQGANVCVAGSTEAADYHLPAVPVPHNLLAPLALIQTFYRCANELSLARGHNPDEPPHLKKVTETV